MWHIGQKAVSLHNFKNGKVFKDNVYTIKNLVEYEQYTGFELIEVDESYWDRRFVPLDILSTELNIEELLSNKV